MKKRKGMSLVEVMMAFVLIGFLVLLVSGAVTSTYKTASALQKLPALYYQGQQEIETELEALEEKVTTKYLYEKELGMQAAQDEALLASLEALEAELEAQGEKITVELFGKEVVVYQFEREKNMEGVGKILLYAGTASGVRLERPVPVLESVGVSPLGESAKAELFDAVGTMLTTEIGYSATNQDYRYAELYQWFISEGTAHSVYYSDGTPGPDEVQHGMVMPVFPASFTLLPTEKSSTLTVTEEYVGHFLCCQVTPLSINGKMGESLMSNLIYISELPVGPAYKAVIDPSLGVYPYSDSHRAVITLLESTSAAAGSFTRTGGSAYVDLNGAASSEEKEIISRFIRFEAADSFKSANGLKPAARDRVYLVVRDREAVPIYLKAGTAALKANAARYESEPGLDGWKIVSFSVSPSRGAAEYTLGGSRFDLAELLIVSEPDDDSDAAIIGYLENKYGIR